MSMFLRGHERSQTERLTLSALVRTALLMAIDQVMAESRIKENE